MGSGRSRIMWWFSFVVVIWHIWKERNTRCFEARSSSMDSLLEKAKFTIARLVSVLPFKGYQSLLSSEIGRK